MKNKKWKKIKNENLNKKMTLYAKFESKILMGLKCAPNFGRVFKNPCPHLGAS
jgi:hypothetical protein